MKEGGGGVLCCVVVEVYLDLELELDTKKKCVVFVDVMKDFDGCEDMFACTCTRM